MQRFVFVRCSWMNRYAGDANDPTIGGGSYVESNPGGERYNFKNVSRKVYGRFQSNRSGGGFKLAGIDPAADGAATLSGVLVIFVAKRPHEGQRVVGWYENARVYSGDRQAGARQRADCDWNMSASTKAAVLLPVDQRVWAVPAGKGGMSTSHVRYPYNNDGSPMVLPWMRSILKQIENYSGPNALGSTNLEDQILADVEKAFAKSGHAGFLADAAARAAVERRAMKAATTHFGGPKHVTDDHIGNPYDLSVLRDGVRTYVEVKGTTGTGAEVLLTAREVRWARKHNTVLFVLHGIKLKKSGGKWVAAGGTPLVIDSWKPAEKALRPIAFRYSVPGA
jgi:hypothetical protein